MTPSWPPRSIAKKIKNHELGVYKEIVNPTALRLLPVDHFAPSAAKNHSREAEKEQEGTLGSDCHVRAGMRSVCTVHAPHQPDVNW